MAQQVSELALQAFHRFVSGEVIPLSPSSLLLWLPDSGFPLEMRKKKQEKRKQGNNFIYAF
jgi:hypothetical protein